MVIKQVKQWMKVRASAAQWKPIAEWAAKRGASFEIDAEGEGFTIEDAKHPMGRLLIEWGEPQRDYLQTPELRLRLDLKLQSDVFSARYRWSLVPSRNVWSWSVIDAVEGSKQT